MIKSYEIPNLSPKETRKEGDYVLERTKSPSKFHFPVDAPRYSYLYAGGEEVTPTCQATLNELENYQYDKSTVNKKMITMRDDVEYQINNRVQMKDDLATMDGTETIVAVPFKVGNIVI